MSNRSLTVAALIGAALTAADPAPPIRFRNIAESAGIHFVLENSPTPQKHLIETMPGGVAIFDYNGDGLPDIFFTNGAALQDPMPKGASPDKHDPQQHGVERQTEEIEMKRPAKDRVDKF